MALRSGLGADQTATEAYTVGQAVRVTVIRADKGESKIRLSLAPGAELPTRGKPCHILPVTSSTRILNPGLLSHMASHDVFFATPGGP